MDSTLLIAGIILGTTLLLVFIFSFIAKKGKQKARIYQENKFNELVSSHSLAIDDKDQFYHYIIAIDSMNKKLIYLNTHSDEKDTKVFDLQTIKSAEENVEHMNIYEDVRGKSVIKEKQVSKLQLILNFKDTAHANYMLTFYQLYIDEITDFAKIKERVAQWKNKINECVKG